MEKFFINFSIHYRLTQVANKFGYGPNRPRQRFPIWFLKKERKVCTYFNPMRLFNNLSYLIQVYDEQISKENQKFLQQTVEEKFGKPIMKRGVLTHEKASTSLIKSEKLPTVQWTPKSIRTGVMGRKIGTYPIWLKNGTRIITTAIQILDNHVIKYTPPEHNNPSNKKHLKDYSKSGMILMGSETVDPNTLTSNYMGLFQQSGVMPKKNLTRFNVSHDAALPPGTELNVLHYKPGEVVDVRGLT
jgi:large subunit ribosomal protein L3